MVDTNDPNQLEHQEMDVLSVRLLATNLGKVKNLYGTCEGFLKKNEKLYGKMLNLTEQVKEFMEKNDEFFWTSERIIWSNGILSIGFLASTVF
jgi:hypothetical protein